MKGEPAKIRKILDKILKSFTEIQICILYGSTAADRLNSESDIDLAVAAEPEISPDLCLSLSGRMSVETGRETSVTSLPKMEGVILSEVLSKGLVVRNENPALLARFITKMYSFSEDVLPLQLAGIKRKTEKYLHG